MTDLDRRVKRLTVLQHNNVPRHTTSIRLECNLVRRSNARKLIYRIELEYD